MSGFDADLNFKYGLPVPPKPSEQSPDSNAASVSLRTADQPRIVRNQNEPADKHTEFTKRLALLRAAENDLLTSLRPDLLEKKNCHKDCVNNYKNRKELIDEYFQYISTEKKRLGKEMSEIPDDIVNSVLREQKASECKNLYFFQEALKAERRREEFYETRIMERFMANFVETEVPN